MPKEPGFISRDHRQPVSLEALAIRLDGSEVGVRVRNISRDGCLVECEGPLLIGEWLHVRMEGFAPTRAKVRWSFMGKAGLHFAP